MQMKFFENFSISFNDKKYKISHKQRKTKQIKKELENERDLIQCAKEFNIMGDLTRLKICYLLCKHQELSVGEIAKIVGVSISAVSHTLQKLKAAKIPQFPNSFYYAFRLRQ